MKLNDLLSLDLIEPLWSSNIGRKLAAATSVLFIIFFILTIYNMLIVLQADWKIDQENINTKPAAIKIMSDLSALTKAHMFGQYGIVDKSMILPITSLDLKLIGVIKSNPSSLSRVIISSGDEPGKVYQIGDTLPVGVSIYEITDAGVVLENSGQYETLPLHRNRLLFGNKPSSLFSNNED